MKYFYSEETVKGPAYEYTEADVLTEIENIKKFVPADKIANLDFENLRGHSENHCIYGQMFGNCNTPEVTEAVKKCCVEAPDMENISTSIRSAYFMSPLENYIFNIDVYNGEVEMAGIEDITRTEVERRLEFIKNAFKNDNPVL